MKPSQLFTPAAGACLWAILQLQAHGQAPSAIYTWMGIGDLRQWGKQFGANTVTLENVVDGELRITETGGAGATVALSDDFNRVRESSTAAAGGADVTGLDFLEFDFGHSGAGPINVQFFIQGSTGSTYRGLGPDVSVDPGVNTYQVPLSELTPEEAVYLRTIGFNARDHAAFGDVTWTLREVRAGGTPLERRDLITHETGTAEGGLQGAIVNFDSTSVLGNPGQQGQTGLSHNPAGSGSLQWTDLGGSSGAAISWGNGTAWNGNTFNNRTTDLSNYETMVVRISAREVTPSGGGSIEVGAFFQVDNFSFQAVENGAARTLPLDGQFYDLTFTLNDLANMNVVDQTGINLGDHATDLVINIDSIVFAIPEPTSFTFLGVAAVSCFGLGRRARRKLTTSSG